MMAWNQYCEECDETTRHTYYGGFQETRWEPGEPAGSTCDKCGEFTQDEGPDDGY